jgi:hypothetical protein
LGFALYVDDECVGDATLQVLEDLAASNINFSLICVSGHRIDMKIGDAAAGVVEQQTVAERFVDAVDWLRDKARELYPDSEFAWKYAPVYRSPYAPGTPAAQAAGCICPPGLDDHGYHYWEAECPEHGSSSIRVIDGESVRVPGYWRPGRPIMRGID